MAKVLAAKPDAHPPVLEYSDKDWPGSLLVDSRGRIHFGKRHADMLRETFRLVRHGKHPLGIAYRMVTKQKALEEMARNDTLKKPVLKKTEGESLARQLGKFKS